MPWAAHSAARRAANRSHRTAPARPAARPLRPRELPQVSSMVDVMMPFRSIWSKLWADAPAEQRKITMQLARNSAYFGAACVLIRHFGEQIAV